MTKQIRIECSPSQIGNSDKLRSIIAGKVKTNPGNIKDFRILKRSIDARGKKVNYNLKIEYSFEGKLNSGTENKFRKQNVSNSKEVLIAGMGPAGIFAALKLIENGLKPVIIEKGKPVEERKHDITAIHRNSEINENSNYSFGEGGAGTYSDGKLYTRSKKKGNIEYVLNTLNMFGASDDILINSRPHIGSDKLPGIIKDIRASIIECGGEIHYNHKISDLLISGNKFKGVMTSEGTKFSSENIILATGHSSSEIYMMLNSKGLPLEFKNFAMGVRIEHPQELINKIRYGKFSTHPELPPAEYNFAVQTKSRGVFSFCMCPGGSVVPASTEDGHQVVNGMSNSRRNLKWGNAGLVAGVTQKDIFKLSGENSALSGYFYQKELEKQAFINGGKGFIAPAQRVTDFLNNKISQSLPEVSYTPGVNSSPMHFWLPDFISHSLQEGIKKANNQLRGYITRESVIIGVESRTSSPVRIPRNKSDHEYIGLSGIFPAGEGAGYAGGIVSSAVDGINTADLLSGKIL